MKEKFDSKKVEELKAFLRGLPEKPKSEQVSITKAELVRELAGEIRTLQKRGYSLRVIANLLSERGVKIGEATLKNYLQRGKGNKASKKEVKRVKEKKESKPEGEQSKPAVRFEVKPDSDDL